MADYTIDKANAEQDAWSFPATLTDPASYASEWASRVTAKYFGQPVLEELLALIYSRVSSKAYSKLWTCIAGLNVGDPVYISATDTVTLALATTEATARVVGFVRSKPSTETCYIEHYLLKTGLAGLTAGNAIYLTDAGGYGAAAGTVAKRIGIATDTDEGVVYASGNVWVSPHAADHITGGADEIDGDKLDIDWTPSNYTPDTTPAEADSVDNLTAHLYGIDVELGQKLENVSEDTSPTLGGALDANAQNITNVAKLLIGATAFDSAASLQETVSDTYAIQRILSASATATYGSYLFLQRARGTQAARTSPLDGDDLGAVYGVGHTGSVWGVSGLVSVLADGNHGADSTPGKLGLWTTPSGAVAGVLRVLVDKDGNVGISEATPGTLLDMAGTAPYFTLHNTTEEDGDGGRECKLIFEGEQSGGELTTLGEIEFSHDGASDDEKGKFVLRLNDGNDGASPTTVMTALSSGYVGIGCTPAVKFNVLGNGLFNTAAGNLDDDVVLIHGQPRVAVVENTYSTADNLWLLAIGNNTAGAVLNFAKTRSNSTDAVTIVQNNDVLMQINGMGADGAGRYRSAAAIRIEVDGTPDSADMPGRIVLATTADGAASVTDRVFVSSSGYVGIGESSPGTLFDMAGTAPYFTLHNTTEEDGDGGRECKLIFEGEQSGTEQTTLGEIEFSHDGASDDEKGKFTLRLNDGSDGTSPTAVITALSSGNVGIGTTAPASLFEVQGGLTTTGAVVTLSSKETSTVDGDVLGRINFRAALDAAGGDAILAGASIWAEADATFSSTVNNTELVFGTATTSVAIEYMRLLADGGLKLSAMKSGATQGAAGAEAGELWKTASHATLVDNVVMIGV